MASDHRFHKPLLGIIFVLLTGYFVWNGSWYDPAVLEIEGTLSSGPTGFDVAWDSGSGLNSYERYKVILNTFANHPSNKINIAYTGKKNGASLTKNIVCRRILADGREVSGSWVELNEQRAELAMEIPAHQSIAIELETNNRSGIARIEVNGKYYERDLYKANIEAKSRIFDFWLISPQNQFTVHVALPRYPTNDLVLQKRRDGRPLKLESINLLSGKNSPISLVDQPQMLSELNLGSISHNQKRYFQWQRLVTQLLFAALSTWLISALLRVYRASGGFSEIVRGEKRVFVIYFAGAAGCYLVWLLIFWPGVMSVDSLKIWRAAQLPEVYLNDHPILNVFLYSYLYHIWNNQAVVPLFHVLVTSLQVATIFYGIHRKHVPLIVLLPCYLFTILSIPIGLYNTVLWKDIPFALLIVFWGYVSAVLFQQKQNNVLTLSAEKILALILLLLSLGLIRHNGLIYLGFIPLLYILLGIIRLQRHVWLALLSIAALVGVGVILVNSSYVTDSGYLFTQGKVYLRTMLASSPVELLQRTWHNYWGILDINQTNSNWDKFHFYFKDRYAYKFLQHARWHDVYPFIPKAEGLLPFFREPAMNLYWKSYQVPLVYLSWNPVWALFLFPICVVLFRWFTLTAIFSAVVLAQVLTLTTLLNVMNWRYYYFACVAACFIIPLIFLDLVRLRGRGTNEV